MDFKSKEFAQSRGIGGLHQKFLFHEHHSFQKYQEKLRSTIDLINFTMSQQKPKVYLKAFFHWQKVEVLYIVVD